MNGVAHGHDLVKRHEAPPRMTAARPDIVTAGLQQLFARVAEEPIPEDFLRLLDAIDDASARLPGSEPGPTDIAQ